MTHGVPPHDAAHLLGAIALVLSFVLLRQRRLRAAVRACAAQAAMVSLAAAWQGWAQDAPSLYLAAAVTLAAQAVLLPLILHRIAGRPGAARAVDASAGVSASLILGLGLVALAALAVPPAPGTTREGLVLALSVVLLGLLAMATRRDAPSQAVGFLSVGNGLILAAVGVPGLPLVAEMSAAVAALGAVAVFGLAAVLAGEHPDGLGRPPR